MSERDILRINGVLCVGANLGFEGVMRVLRRKVSEAHLVADKLMGRHSTATLFRVKWMGLRRSHEIF